MTVRLPVVFTAKAAKAVDEASQWWLANRPKAPEALGVELTRALEIISQQPNIGAPATNFKFRGVRRIHLIRIRYFLYYRIVAKPPGIQILSFWHTSRG